MLKSERSNCWRSVVDEGRFDFAFPPLSRAKQGHFGQSDGKEGERFRNGPSATSHHRPGLRCLVQVRVFNGEIRHLLGIEI